MARNGRQLGHRWRVEKAKRVRQLVAESGGHLTCWLCGGAIDMNLSGRNPAGLTLDHVNPRFAGGDEFDMQNTRPAHNRCNAIRGARQAGEARRRKPRQHKPRVVTIKMTGPPGMERPWHEW